MRRTVSVIAIVAVTGGSATAAPLPAAPNCPVFPADNPWNQDISQAPVAPNSSTLIDAIGRDRPVHPDFSDAGRYGIPFNVVRSTQRKVRVTFQYASESNRGPYPIPVRPRIESGSDRHILIIDRDACRLYELFDARRVNGRWRAGSGAIFNLRSNALRPAGWTSADAAGLPIFPGLARAHEVRRGVIDHALRFTAPRTRNTYVYPARHHAGRNDPTLPPMGTRVRLKASVDVSRFGPQSRVVLTALKRYGMILADNGSPWFITGAPSAAWDDDDLRGLRSLTGDAFEVIDPSALAPGG